MIESIMGLAEQLIVVFSLILILVACFLIKHIKRLKKQISNDISGPLQEIEKFIKKPDETIQENKDLLDLKKIVDDFVDSKS